MSTVAVIVAGGTGERFGRSGGKQLAPLAGGTVLSHSLAALEASGVIDEIIVVTNPAWMSECAEEVARFDKVVAVVAGGATRGESVAAGLAFAPSDADVLVIHDGARPLVDSGTVTSAVEALRTSSLDGVVVGHPAYDTVKRVDDSAQVVGTEDRAHLWLAQTPQVFRARALLDAYAAAEALGVTGTDDAALVEQMGGHVRMLLGPRDNLKITVPEDLAVAEQLLALRGERA